MVLRHIAHFGESSALRRSRHCLQYLCPQEEKSMLSGWITSRQMGQSMDRFSSVYEMHMVHYCHTLCIHLLQLVLQHRRHNFLQGVDPRYIHSMFRTTRCIILRPRERGPFLLRVQLRLRWHFSLFIAYLYICQSFKYRQIFQKNLEQKKLFHGTFLCPSALFRNSFFRSLFTRYNNNIIYI